MDSSIFNLNRIIITKNFVEKNMKKLKFICAIFALFCVNVVNLSAESLKNITSISADFTQEIKGDDGGIKYSGHLVARADSKAHWRYETPMKKEIFVNGKSVMIYEPEFAQVIISDKMDIDFVRILNSVRQSENGVGDEWQSVVNNQTFRIVLKGDKPHKILYKDELDNDIIITLKNVALNAKISDEVFNFKRPQGVDVIYQ